MKKILSYHILALLFISGAYAQDLPLSIIEKGLIENVDLVEMNKLENIAASSNDDIDLLNYTFAISYSNVNLIDSGKWIKSSNGEWIWLLKVSSVGAKGLSFDLEDLQIANGDKLFFYSLRDKIEVEQLESMSEDFFQSRFIKGDEIYLEYNPAVNDTTELFSQDLILNHALKDIAAINGFGDADNCEINANCNTDEEKQFEKRSTVRIRTRKTVNGNTYLGWCTGTLIATTEREYEPYILTADHCYSIMVNGSYVPTADEDLAQWLFYFNYDSPTCDDPISESEVDFTMFQGASILANSGGAGDYDSDFCLVELFDNIDISTNAFWAGWNAIDAPSYEGYSFHHPSGDVKKVNIFNGNTESSKYDPDGPDGTHWKVYWESGVTEGGSSGSSILNSEGQIIGVLTGGLSGCFSSEQTDLYGKFALSYEWDTDINRQLKHWLNPNKQDIVELMGYDYNGDKDFVYAEEILITPNPIEDDIINLGKIDFRLLKSVRVYSISGALVWEGNTFTSTKINIDLRSGIYIVETTFDSKVETHKILVLN